MNQEQKVHKIDAIALLRKLYLGKRQAIRESLIITGIGMILTLISPSSFQSGSMFVPLLSSDSNHNNLSGLASLAGIDIQSTMGSSEISPNLYPEIIQSLPFKEELGKVKIPHNGKMVTFKSYETNYKSNLFHSIKKGIRTLKNQIMIFFNLNKHDLLKDAATHNKLFFIENDDYVFYTSIEDYISINVDLNEGFIELLVEYDDPIRSAILAQKAQEILQKKVIEYKISHAKEVLNYTIRQSRAKRSQLYSAQSNLAGFKDRNVFISTSTFQNQLIRLEMDFNNANDIYLEVSKQVEQAKLQVNKDTPIFSILKPVVVPNERSSPKLIVSLILWAILGFIVSSVQVLFKEQIQFYLSKVTLKGNFQN